MSLINLIPRSRLGIIFSSEIDFVYQRVDVQKLIFVSVKKCDRLLRALVRSLDVTRQSSPGVKPHRSQFP